MFLFKGKPDLPMSNNNGTTLIELIFAIVILSIGLTGIFSALIAITAKSSDPLIEMQAISIGQSYLEEILSKEFPATNPCSFSSGTGARTRASYNNICDYSTMGNSKPSPVQDQFGNNIKGLENYKVTVNIDFNTLLTYGPDAVRVNVIVYHPVINQLLLTGYKLKYKL